jgi:hypothetical protein
VGWFLRSRTGARAVHHKDRGRQNRRNVNPKSPPSLPLERTPSQDRPSSEIFGVAHYPNTNGDAGLHGEGPLLLGGNIAILQQLLHISRAIHWRTILRNFPFGSNAIYSKMKNSRLQGSCCARTRVTPNPSLTSFGSSSADVSASTCVSDRWENRKLSLLLENRSREPWKGHAGRTPSRSHPEDAMFNQRSLPKVQTEPRNSP